MNRNQRIGADVIRIRTLEINPVLRLHDRIVLHCDGTVYQDGSAEDVVEFVGCHGHVTGPHVYASLAISDYVIRHGTSGDAARNVFAGNYSG
jgi:hypothetical protein